MRLRKGIPFIIASLIIFSSAALLSRSLYYTLIDIENISRYDEDRLVFQHIESQPVEYQVESMDNSIATLLIIKDQKMYLFKDGYDNPGDVLTQARILSMENQLFPDLWKIKIDGKPDYMRVTDRRVEIMKRQAKSQGAENERNLDENSIQLYNKIRDSFISQHVNNFRSYMINRRDTGLIVERHPIAKKLTELGETRFFTSVSAKTIDEKVYYAEDADGDGITETFTVSIPDGFNWGYQSGPNIICIIGCRYRDEEGKEKNTRIRQLIGNLTNDAYYGTAEEARIIEKSFLKESDVERMIQDLYPIHPDQAKLLKEGSEGGK